MEMKLRTAGDQLLVELSNVLETREAFPAEVSRLAKFDERHDLGKCGRLNGKTYRRTVVNPRISEVCGEI